MLLGIFIILSGCNISKNLKSDDNMVKQPVIQVNVTTNLNEKVIVPNPQTIDRQAQIILKDNAFFENEDDLCVADLSFAGLDEAMKVSAFAIGNVTSTDSTMTHISYDFSDDITKKRGIKLGAQDKDIIGGCLILSASTIPPHDREWDSKHYIIVLDYSNKEYYVTETGLQVSFLFTPDLVLKDLTGDGLDDIVVSNCLNGDNQTCEVFRFDTKGLKLIYNTDWIGTKQADEYLSLGLGWKWPMCF